jgi:uncharacterized membrane protein YgcG
MSTLSGKQALEQIDAALGRARGSLSGVDSEFGQARSALATIHRQQLGAYAGLAQLRLLDIEQGGLVESLDSADRDAHRILEQRSAAVAKLEADIDEAESALGADEARRSKQQEIVAAASEVLDAAEAAAQATLADDAAYRAQLAETEQADFVADQAEAKAADSNTDRIEKGKHYEDDSLFAYLWARGFGTSRYRAGPIARFCDRRVARLIDYEPARKNYALLTEIPKRLAEHAVTMRAEFERAAKKLAALEGAAAAAAGVPARRDELDIAERNLADIDQAIAERENAIADLVRRRKAFAAGEDEHYRHSIEVLSLAMQRQSIDFLRERAARTVHRDDDDLVQRLAELDAEAERIERNLGEFRRLHDRESDIVGKLEDVRRRFKSKGFDDVISEFKDAALITLILREFLRGAAGAGDVWKTIERQQRTRRVKADPHFGTRRFPKSPTPGPWRMPKGGGFKTGGGFRGGGFKTGGGSRGGGFRTRGKF